MELIQEQIHDVLLLLAVVNPIGNIPIYADLTRDCERKERNRIVNIAVGIALCLVIAFSLVGDWSLRNIFDVTIDEFKIAGGILLFIVAVRGVMSGVKSYTDALSDRRMLAVFPLAFPIIVGPGTLAVTIILAQSAGSVQMVTVSLTTFLIVFVIARNSHLLMRLVGRYGGMIIPRLLYVFLASKAVAMVLEGIVTFVKSNVQ